MDYTGYTRKFPNNRPLNAFDREHRLLQKKRLDVVPLAQLCVVKMNSNGLVSVDRWFAARGFAALLGTIGIAFGLGGMLMLLWLLIVNRLPNENGLWEAIFIGMAMLAAFTAASIWVACLELFRWTYYPIALDRKHREIHVFRLDGTTLSVPWDQVYFTLGRGTGTFGWYNWDVSGLILDADGVTVRETFAFCIATSRIENAHAHWEFLRRYMEEEPAAVVDAVHYCMPLDGKRESFASGKERIFAEDAQLPGFMWLTMLPLNYLHRIMRWVVMQTSRIPRFPPDIEARLTPDAGDPCVRDASMNPPDLR